MTTQNNPIRDSASESGSAYLVTLMVVFILTIIGLSLTVITQTEVMASSSERSSQGVFYAANSGVDVAIAQVLIDSSCSSNVYRISESKSSDISGAYDRDAVLTMEELVEVTPVVPIADSPCNLCQINQGSTFKKINHALESTATRTGTPTATPNAEGVPLARKSITAMVDIQPMEPLADCYSGIDQGPGPVTKPPGTGPRT
jgi:hypothetical protein